MSGGNGGAGSGVYPPMRFSTDPTQGLPGAHGTPLVPPAPGPVPPAEPPPSRRLAPGRASGARTPGRRAAAPPGTAGSGARLRPVGVADDGGGDVVVALRPDAAGAAADDFSAFYREAWPGVARALAVALGDRDLAVDATDEAMARAYPRWSRLATYDNPGAWVYRVGLNWARSHRRRLARRPPVEHAGDEHLPPVGDPAVRAALLSLPLAQRSVVVCRLLLDWSVEDTAIALGVRPGTVQSRLHRALRSLHDALDHLR